MKGGIHLVCGPDSAGRSALRHQYVSAPMHISKPWWDDGVLIVNAINSTAGLFSGDVIESTIEVRSGAQMLVTSPSASRAYRMPKGSAMVKQSIRVATGAWLEMLPALFIPHAGSHYLQEATIDLEPGARFLWFETFAPGRVASGEAWQFTRFASHFQLIHNSKLIALETYSLGAGSPAVQAIRHHFPNACHGTCYAVGNDFPDEVLAGITAMHHAECWVGCTRLEGPAIAIRIVAADNIQLTRTLRKVRACLHGSFGRSVPSMRRN